MKMFDEIKFLKKSYVYEQYTRIVKETKDYEKITKMKMLSAIYEVYDNPTNIIDICTTRELKYLKMILENQSVTDDKYDWERINLIQKFLLESDFHEENAIPEEIVDKVKDALKRVNWQEKKKIDDLNELLVSYCKIQGSALLNTVCQFASGITGIDRK